MNFSPEASIPQSLMFSWASQVQQYPWRGPEGISYFAGVMPNGTVHCLLYRERRGHVVGILNYYDKDFPPFEKAGNVNIFIHKNFKRRGIGTALWKEAQRRWPVTLVGQRYSPEGAEFARALLAKESVDATPE